MFEPVSRASGRRATHPTEKRLPTFRLRVAALGLMLKVVGALAALGVLTHSCTSDPASSNQVPRVAVEYCAESSYLTVADAFVYVAREQGDPGVLSYTYKSVRSELRDIARNTLSPTMTRTEARTALASACAAAAAAYSRHKSKAGGG